MGGLTGLGGQPGVEREQRVTEARQRRGVVGPMTVAIGTTTPDSFAADRTTSPATSSASAAAMSGAQPSATTAARIERRSGSQTSASSMRGLAVRTGIAASL